MNAAASRFPDLPQRMRDLPVDHRGFPVPWFVYWEDGKPNFPIADTDKYRRAVKEKRCWVCGGELGRVFAFVIGPMCAVNRTSSEPPSHIDCARFSARNCPFLAQPRMKRVPVEKLKGGESPGGSPILRNPGVALVWITKRYEQYDDGSGGRLFEIGRCQKAEWYAEGRAATREEVLESIKTGLPFLIEEARKDPKPGAMAALSKMEKAVRPLLPA